MGGMAAQIPIRGDAGAHAQAMARVRDDKLREARAGHDGTWIAHPALAEIAREAFDSVMHGTDQLHVMRDDVKVTAADLLRVPTGDITEEGLRHNIRVGVQYLAAWLGGQGCVPLYHLMEDAATAEICRAQLWQWLRHGAATRDGRPITVARFDSALGDELAALHAAAGDDSARRHLATAAGLLGDMVRKEDFDDFLTLPAYALID